MLFNSVEFLIFAALFFGGWPLLRRRDNLRWLYITAASFLFYGWWDWRFLFLLAGSGLLDFLASLGMQRWPTRRRWLLAASLCGNVGSLMLFKYLDFGLRNVNVLLGLLGVEARVPLAGLVLPVGISFYTFQSMSYTIDVYRGQLQPTRNVLHFFAYLAMFPQLVAGPIVRAADLLPQMASARPTTEADRWDGLRLILRGFARKVIVADSLAPVVNAAFAAAAPADASAYWWVVMTLFAVQIYCDFSGYSDIACGLARWMGMEFQRNFDHPYGAGSLREFWARWHISLSTWFRDYLYVPLGGSRGSPARAHGNLWATMLVSGLWHGASWTFVIWGALHALYCSAERLTRWPERLARLPGGRALAGLAVFVLVLVAWVFFRAQSLSQALTIAATMVRFTHADADAWGRLLGEEKALALAALLLAHEAWVHLRAAGPWPALAGAWNRHAARWAATLQPAVYALLAASCIYLRGSGSAFIYFQF